MLNKTLNHKKKLYLISCSFFYKPRITLKELNFCYKKKAYLLN